MRSFLYRPFSEATSQRLRASNTGGPAVAERAAAAFRATHTDTHNTSAKSGREDKDG